MTIRLNYGGARKWRELDRGSLILGLRRWLIPASAVALAVAIWRLAYDLDLATQFAIPMGVFSHWQIWLALAVLLLLLAEMLRRSGQGGAATP